MAAQHTVRVCDVPLKVGEQEIRDFFSFSGEIVHVELQRDAHWTQVAFVTFKGADAVDTALLLSGTKLADHTVTIIRMQGYVLPTSRADDEDDLEAYDPLIAPEYNTRAALADVLSQGMVMGKTAAIRVKQFDERVGLSATAIATAAALDQKLGIVDSLNARAAVINDQLRGVDDKYKVSSKTKTALAVAEEKRNAFMKNRYVLSGAAWATDALSKLRQAAEDAGQRTRERATGHVGDHRPAEPYRGNTAVHVAATAYGYDEYETHEYDPYSYSGEAEEAYYSEETGENYYSGEMGEEYTD